MGGRSTRKRQVKARWGALSVELELWKTKAETFFYDKLASHCGGFLHLGLKLRLSGLAGDGQLREEELLNLSQVLANAQDFNRGLNLVVDTQSGRELTDFHNRNLLYAAKLTPDGIERLTELGLRQPFESVNYYTLARNVIDKYLSWRRRPWRCFGAAPLFVIAPLIEAGLLSMIEGGTLLRVRSDE